MQGCSIARCNKISCNLRLLSQKTIFGNLGIVNFRHGFRLRLNYALARRNPDESGKPVALSRRTDLLKLDVGQDKFNIAKTVVVIYLGLICNVEEIMLKELLFQFSHPKADTAD